METIKAYVENVFRTLPNTPDILRVKEEILSNMLDKYNELKASGRSEHEAVGIVISEFGNIDELLEEMNLLSPTSDFEKKVEKDASAEYDSSLRYMSMAEVKDYLTSYIKASKIIALGVLLCIVGTSLLIFLCQLAEDNLFSSVLKVDGDDMFGLILFFLFIVIAVGLFIKSGMDLSKFEYVSKGIKLDQETVSFLNAKKAELQPAFTKNLIIGVSMCVISPLLLIGGYAFVSDESSYPVSIFLLIIAVAVYILVSSGIRFGCLSSLLTEYQKTPIQRKSNSITGSFCGTIMLVATAIFLYYGFVENQWQYAPAIYAIGGVLCGVVSIIINAVQTYRNKN